MRLFKMQVGGPNFFPSGGRGGVEIFFDICVFPPCASMFPIGWFSMVLQMLSSSSQVFLIWHNNATLYPIPFAQNFTF